MAEDATDGEYVPEIPPAIPSDFDLSPLLLIIEDILPRSARPFNGNETH